MEFEPDVILILLLDFSDFYVNINVNFILYKSVNFLLSSAK